MVTVSEKLKRISRILRSALKIKVRFQFIDQTVIFEDWAKVQLNEKGEFKQVDLVQG